MAERAPGDGMRRRLAAVASLACAAVSAGIAIALAVGGFPRGLTVLVCVVAAVVVGWMGAIRQGAARATGVTVAALLLAGAVAIVAIEGRLLGDLLVLAFFALSVMAARVAFAPRAELPLAPRVQHPVLFYNPKSGGGKAERFHLADEARARGVEPVELRPGDDLRELVQTAVAGGADALAMAGGDGSQAIVAAEAAKLGLSYACIPSGTRNHFALDLGVDRDDVVGALDALLDGRERVVDLAEVNGRVFVNNVSLGVYAEAVQRGEYRDAKLRTLAQTAPRVLGSDGSDMTLRFDGPDGRERKSGAALLVSNDPYRLGRAVGSGTRPRLDSGTLGVAAFGSANGGRHRTPLSQWSCIKLEVRAERPVAAGIDGEALSLDPPLVFRSRPAALRVRIAQHHPGASPSALLPPTPWGIFGALARVAFGRPA